MIPMSSMATNPTTSQTLRVMNLMIELVAAKHDSTLQERVLIEGLNRLLNATIAWFFVIDDYVAGKTPRLRHQVLTGDPDPLFLRSMRALGIYSPLHEDPDADPVIAPQLRAAKQEMPPTHAGWSNTVSMSIIRDSNVKNGMVCLRRCRSTPDRVVGVAISRRLGSAFTPRHRALLRLTVQQIETLVSNGHLALPASQISILSPRLQQTLHGLLDGHAPKQLARSMNLSVWTVREYVQRIYKHFGVSGREELRTHFMHLQTKQGPTSPDKFAHDL